MPSVCLCPFCSGFQHAVTQKTRVSTDFHLQQPAPDRRRKKLARSALSVGVSRRPSISGRTSRQISSTNFPSNNRRNNKGPPKHNTRRASPCARSPRRRAAKSSRSATNTNRAACACSSGRLSVSQMSPACGARKSVHPSGANPGLASLPSAVIAAHSVNAARFFTRISAAFPPRFPATLPPPSLLPRPRRAKAARPPPTGKTGKPPRRAIRRR